jgi:hypothetical protein
MQSEYFRVVPRDGSLDRIRDYSLEFSHMIQVDSGIRAELDSSSVYVRTYGANIATGQYEDVTAKASGEARVLCWMTPDDVIAGAIGAIALDGESVSPLPKSLRPVIENVGLSYFVHLEPVELRADVAQGLEYRWLN